MVEGLPNINIPMEMLKIVLLVNNIVTLSRTEKHGELSKFYSWCTQTFVDQSIRHLMETKALRLELNENLASTFRPFGQIVTKTFWAEAVNWSIHILNRSPTLAVKNITPQEAWSKVRPSVDHLRIFGCISYAHVPNEKRTKLDDKSVKCVFIGKIHGIGAATNNNKTLKDVEEVGEESQKSEPQLHSPTQSLGEILPNPSTSVSTPHQDQSSISEEQRPRRRPFWMNDYESGGKLSDEDTIAHFPLFTCSDPILFAEAVKEEKWKKTMDAEIEAIEKNKT
ncbi:putative copia-type polyprotein [Trifolium pratense]|uniref:Putative copia-type polyprotein n=1 Tax=Trifolium pratense TaxID=57577 RepID=A0A2K3NSF4_TRIPR|nr:putative copia-type polyprotein [Trifolium pratense]